MTQLNYSFDALDDLMEAAGIFRVVSTLVLPGWLLLILVPRLAFH